MDENLLKIIQNQQETIRDLLRIIETLSKNKAVITPISPSEPYQPIAKPYEPWKCPAPYRPYVGDIGEITIPY